MSLIVDTCVALFVLMDSPRLSKASSQLLLDAPVCYISAISLAEIEIKRSIGKLIIDNHYRKALTVSGFVEMPFEGRDARHLGTLPYHHKDPFDRMLISQAMERKMPIITVDDAFASYPIQVHLNR
jgi:PIN domain nuclease of toxin-antitoxin system